MYGEIHHFPALADRMLESTSYFSMVPFLRPALLMGLLLLVQPQTFVAGGEVLEPVGVGRFSQSSISTRLAEYQLKARYLSILPDYVTWPEGQGRGKRPLVIGVIGDSLFEDYLNDLFAPGKPHSRSGRVVYLQNRQALETCDVLFICESESEWLYEILKRVKGRSILTIGDSPDFARRGVMINLVMERDRITLEVNLLAVRNSNLEISSHVLKNAKLID